MISKTAITFSLRPDSELYEEIRYPAGETQIRLRPGVLERFDAADEIRLIARIATAQDLISLLLLGSALEQNSTPVELILPYLPYSRADRRFQPGDCAGLALFGDLMGCVISRVFSPTHTLDAHNPAMAEKHVPDLINHSPLSLVHRAIADFAIRHNAQRLTVLFPDEGARGRYVVPGHLSCNTGSLQLDVLHCSKHRNVSTGKFEGFSVPDVDAAQPAIIIDDICDGGGTFLGIAGELRKQHGDWWPAKSLGLYVTHGIFSKGFGALNEAFDHIYTTNTLPEKGPNALVTVYDAMPILLG